MTAIKKIACMVTLAAVGIFVLIIMSHPKPNLIAMGGKKAIYRKVTQKKVVSLTFDDGPDPRYTLPILDILQATHTPATFFMVGNNVMSHPEIAKKIVAAGHEVGDHTMTHPNMPDLNPKEARREIEQGFKTIVEVTGVAPKFYRSPKGLTTPDVQAIVQSYDMTEVLWTFTIEHKESHTPEAMAKRVLSKVQPGSIILLHDGRLNRTKTVQALPLLIKGLREQGYQIVPLSELLQSEDDQELQPLEYI